jgi:hypothetical protein
MDKNASYAFVLLALTLLIVLPGIGSVNAAANSTTGLHPVLLASGQPMPPPVPPAVSDSTLMVSGQPMPAPVPPAANESILVASGQPMPPPVPPVIRQSVLTAG